MGRVARKCVQEVGHSRPRRDGGDVEAGGVVSGYDLRAVCRARSREVDLVVGGVAWCGR